MENVVPSASNSLTWKIVSSGKATEASVGQYLASYSTIQFHVIGSCADQNTVGDGHMLLVQVANSFTTIGGI